jgi:hypothetical protein
MIRKLSIFQPVAFSFSFLVLWIHKMIMFYLVTQVQWL